MIQGTINQLLGLGAAASRSADIADARAERALKSENRAIQARDKAIQRAKKEIQAKFDQRKSYQDFMESLKSNQAPDMLKRIAYEEAQRQKNTDVRIGGAKVDISKLSPEARAFLTGRDK